MGAYYFAFAPFIPTGAALKVLPGVYDVKALSYGVKGVFTNTVPVDAYRGAGRPESIYCIERLMDYAADQLGVDPVELRRRNFIRPEQMPFKTAAGELYDTGEFAKVMDTCLTKADWAGIAARRAKAQATGRLRGIGMCYYIESTMGDPTEHAAIEFAEDGYVNVLVGTQTNGQGHDTAYAQVLHQPSQRAVREDPHRPGRHRPHPGRRRHRRLALADRAGHGDQRRFGPRHRARQGIRGPAVRDRGGRHPVPGGHLPRRRHRPRDRHHGARRQGAGDGADAWAWRAG